MFRYFLTLSYKGEGLNGWQIQLNTPNTVQQIVQEKMGMILQRKVELTGCGRTDTGVNAKNYIAHFDCDIKDLSENEKHWVYKFNTVLPAGIAIQSIRKVKTNAHARFDALQRTYYYYLSKQKNPFRDAFTWYVYGNLDFEKMNKGAEILLQYKDFTSFSKLRTQNKTNICHISKARWLPGVSGEWRFEISADRFLRGMVRAIVGTLVMLGQGKITIQEFKQIIEARNRKVAGNNAPANALFLSGIKYPKEIYID